MALKPPPILMGRHEIVVDVNDQVTWFEDDNVGHTDTLTCVLTPGTYYVGLSSAEVGSLLEEIKTQMETASDAGALAVAPHVGVGVDYELAIDPETGKLTIGCDAPWGNPTFYPILTHAGATDKALVGGDPGAAGDGRRMSPHLGWNQDAVVPAAGISFTSDVAIGHSFFPDITYYKDDHSKFEIPGTSEGVALGGDVQAYDFSGVDYDQEGEEIYQQVRSLYFKFLSDASRLQFLAEFYFPHAKQGLPDGRFRFYEDRTVDSHQEYGLTGKSLRDVDFQRTNPGLIKWTTDFTMRRYKAPV